MEISSLELNAQYMGSGEKLAFGFMGQKTHF